MLALAIAALSRSKKLPKAEKLLEKSKKARRKKPMAWQDMLKVAERLAGGKAK